MSFRRSISTTCAPWLPDSQEIREEKRKSQLAEERGERLKALEDTLIFPEWLFKSGGMLLQTKSELE